METKEKFTNNKFKECAKALEKVLKISSDRKSFFFINWIEVFYPYFAEEVYASLKKTKNIRLNSATIWKVLMFSIVGMKNAKWSKQKMKFVVSKLLKKLNENKTDIFCKHNYYLIKNNNIEIINKAVKLPSTSTILTSLLWTLCEAEYGEIHTLGEEIHGPYSSGDNLFLFYDFYNFNVLLNKRKGPKIRIISMFDKKTTFKFDIFDNFYFSKPPLKQWVVLNNKFLNTKEIKTLEIKIKKAIPKAMKKWNVNWKNKLKVNLKIFWLMIKGINPKVKFPTKILNELDENTYELFNVNI